MLGFRRLLPSLRVLVCVILLLLSFEAVHRALYPRLSTGIRSDRRQMQKMSAMAQALASSGEPVSVIIGHSTAGDGFGLARLQQETGERWSKFTILGGSYRVLESFTKPLLRSGVRVPLVLLSMHPLLLSRQRHRPYPEETREKISSTLEMLAQTLQGSGFSGSEDMPPEVASEGLQVAGTGYARGPQFEGWRERGALDPASFTSASSDYQAARRLLVSLSAMADRLVIVKMPEERMVQDAVPGKAEEMFRQVSQGYEVLDLQDILEPSDFIDGVHPNASGRAKVTEATLQWLREHPKRSVSEGVPSR